MNEALLVLFRPLVAEELADLRDTRFSVWRRPFVGGAGMFYVEEGEAITAARRMLALADPNRSRVVFVARCAVRAGTDRRFGADSADSAATASALAFSVSATDLDGLNRRLVGPIRIVREFRRPPGHGAYARQAAEAKAADSLT